MKIAQLEKLFEENKTNELGFEGNCHDCGVELTVLAKIKDDGISVENGAVYNPEINGKPEFFAKCTDCYLKDPVLRGYQPVECYSRVVGYMRPIENWNNAKKSEFSMRKTFRQDNLEF
jgi:hypothetical protein